MLAQRNEPLNLPPGSSLRDAAAIAELISSGLVEGNVVRSRIGSIITVENITITAAGRKYLKEQRGFFKRHAGAIVAIATAVGGVIVWLVTRSSG